MSVHFVFPNDHTQSAWLNQTRALNVVRRAPAAAGSVRGCAEPRSRRAGAAGSPAELSCRYRSRRAAEEHRGTRRGLGRQRCIRAAPRSPVRRGQRSPWTPRCQECPKKPPFAPPGSFRHGTHSAGSSGRSSVIRRALTLSTPGASGGAREVRCTNNASYRGSFMGEGCRDQRGINDTLLPKCVTPGNHL